MFRNVIWDFDGTLFDSYPFINRSLDRALKDLGITEKPELIARQLKISSAAAVSYFKTKYSLDGRLKNLFNQHQHNDETSLIKPYPGSFEICQEIIRHGGGNYLYTHRGKSALQFLDQFHMRQFFTDCITKEYSFPRKPDPSAISYLIEKYDFDKQETIMIGDRDIDILAARHAGISGCLFDPEDDYINFETPYRIHRITDLHNILF